EIASNVSDSTLLHPHKEASMTLRKPQYPQGCDTVSLSRDRKTAQSPSLTRRGFLTRSVAALSVGPLVFASNYANTMTTSESDAVLAAAPAPRQATEDRSIRPFTVSVPQHKI